MVNSYVDIPVPWILSQMLNVDSPAFGLKFMVNVGKKSPVPLNI